jgi:hypothetical protein
MRILVALAGWFAIGAVLLDVFNTIISARRTRNSFRLSRGVYRLAWPPWAAIGKRISAGKPREAFLAVFGPLSLITIFGLWAIVLILAFAVVQWAVGLQPAREAGTLANDLFSSATTFLTLASPDPRNAASRLITAVEAGVGFSLLGLVVGYLPVFYQAFARREFQISLLDARGGSPPSALELLKVDVSDARRVERYLEHWEKWAAEVLENQLSFPMMAWFRSHHANQSWLTALTAMIDCAAAICICAEGDLRTQAEFTFAMGRHALADSAATLRLTPQPPGTERLNPDDLDEVRETIRKSPLRLNANLLSKEKIAELRGMYESHANALSLYLLMALPSWKPAAGHTENWRRIRKGECPDASFAVSDPFGSKTEL